MEVGTKNKPTFVSFWPKVVSLTLLLCVHRPPVPQLCILRDKVEEELGDKMGGLQLSRSKVGVSPSHPHNCYVNFFCLAEAKRMQAKVGAAC